MNLLCPTFKTCKHGFSQPLMQNDHSLTPITIIIIEFFVALPCLFSHKLNRHCLDLGKVILQPDANLSLVNAHHSFTESHFTVKPILNIQKKGFKNPFCTGCRHTETFENEYYIREFRQIAFNRNI